MKMIKNIKLIAIFIIGCSIQSQAQVEFKVNPIGLLFGGIQAEMEIQMRKDIGMAIEVIGGPEIGGGVLLHGKYYFKAEGLDKGYIGIMAGYFGGEIGEGFGFGFEGGYKWVGSRRVLFEIALGLGRAVGDPFPYGKLVVGYRLTKKSKD